MKNGISNKFREFCCKNDHWCQSPKSKCVEKNISLKQATNITLHAKS